MGNGNGVEGGRLCLGRCAGWVLGGWQGLEGILESVLRFILGFLLGGEEVGGAGDWRV